jgi:hypothetical protein
LRVCWVWLRLSVCSFYKGFVSLDMCSNFYTPCPPSVQLYSETSQPTLAA